jgi:amino acid transporter
MSSVTGPDDADRVAAVNPRRLFAASCFGVGASAMTFVAIIAAPQDDAAKTAKELLGPAENHDGKVSFRSGALLSVLLTVVFGLLFLRDPTRGGYKAETLSTPDH